QRFCRSYKEKIGTQLAIINSEGSNNRRYWKVRTNVVKTYVGSSLDVAQPLIPQRQSSHPLGTCLLALMLARAYVMEMFAKLRAWACQESEVLTKDIDKEGWLSEQAKASCHPQTHQSSYKHSSLCIGQEDLITVSCLESVASVAACLPGNRWFDSCHLRSISYDHTDKT
ncbi:hypothetical protein CMEL01_01693, partial [Colletotrichum melonis]